MNEYVHINCEQTRCGALIDCGKCAKNKFLQYSKPGYEQIKCYVMLWGWGITDRRILVLRMSNVMVGVIHFLLKKILRNT